MAVGLAGAPGSASRHHFAGAPSCADGLLLVRTGYVNCYDEGRRVPTWVAFRVEPDYLNQPRRNGRFERFRTDPDMDRAVRYADYTGSGYDRGHLAPYAIMGGDRDGDGLYADLDESASDPDEERTVFEANYMSNMAPQRGVSFNRSPGVWRKVEQFIQDSLVAQEGATVWVTAGAIYGPAALDRIGPEGDIEVPPLFYQIVTRLDDDGAPIVLAFLLPHHERAHGEIEDYLVSVDVIEALTGRDFFHELPDPAEDDLEAADTFRNWE